MITQWHEAYAAETVRDCQNIRKAKVMLDADWAAA